LQELFRKGSFDRVNDERPPEGPTYRRLQDPRELAALAHPVRLGIMELLTVSGPLTATELADRLDETPANCSWHLRKLAEHGFVREARGGTGRNRPWQAVSEGLEWGDDGPDGSDRIAAEALTDMVVEREMQRLRAARAARDSEPEDWREATGLAQSQLWLTAEEARLLKQELTELLLTHADRSGHPDRRPEGARLVSLVGWLVPSGPHRPPAPAEDGPGTP
jgi:DNA-binding transcriptional ArsR family regulator